MYIYLIRHGEICFEDNEKKCIGITNIKLSNDGRIKAEQVSELLKDRKINKVYTSPLSRCLDFSKIICNKLEIPYFIEDDLKEINMGIWENLSFKKIKQLYKYDYVERGLNIKTFKIRDGESFEECSERAQKVFKKICNENKKNDKNIAIVTHSGIIRCLLSSINNIPLENILDIKVDYGTINIVEL
ncbi:histidine phosphatase family protein [Terrisporobacter sp.]